MTSSNFSLGKTFGRAVTLDTFKPDGTLGTTVESYSSALQLPGDAEVGDTAMVGTSEYLFGGGGWYLIKADPPSVDVTVTGHTQCIDHHGGLSYNYDTGELRISSHTTGTFGYGNIHTGRTDCGSVPQGLIVVHTFSNPTYDLNMYDTFSGTARMDGRDGDQTINFSFDVSTETGNSGTTSITNFGVTDTSSGAATYTFTVSGTYS